LPPRAVALEIDRHQLAALGVARNEERIYDLYRRSGFDPFKRPDQATLEARVGPESVHQELGGLHAQSVISWTRLNIIRIG
jgi:hypothetical protein